MPLRAEPSHRAEQTSQVLFGENVEILELAPNEWAKIKTAYDEYTGFCKISQLQTIALKEYNKESKYIASSNNDVVHFEEGQMWLPMGAELRGMNGNSFPFMGKIGKYKGKKELFHQLQPTCENIIKTAQHYLHAPYQWGGKTIAGIDCSGFSQLVFKLNGIRIQRDAYQQAQQGTTVDFLQNAKAGDLAFFDNTEEKITHVGILLNAHNIMHATETSGKVVIDRIDNEGIISVSLKKRTHQLRFVKRYF
ncbi:MAG: hypothetical protein RLZZ196_2475 [Bacteroidota bacterium]|jgi:cell wall-associated NlpC family hydrolase